MARQGRIYADYAESQWYAEPKRLERLGYLSARKEPGKTRPRTHYTLTDEGRAAVRDWMKEPTSFSRIQLEPAWRLLAADLVGEETARHRRAGRRLDPAPGPLPLAQPRSGAGHRRRPCRLAQRGRASARS
jgi:DNA-binding PadR family transcriptional regulator